jgi:hypothetical protein
MRVSFYLFIILMNQIPILAQETIHLSGKVVDADNGAPLSYTSIYIDDKAFLTFTNEAGEFNLRLNKDNSSITFDYLGYKQLTISLTSKTTHLVIKLEAYPLSTETMKVYGYSWAERFMLDCMDKRDSLNQALQHYRVQAYNKTALSSPIIRKNGGLFGIYETISNLTYLQPDNYHSEVQSLYLPPHMKGLPTELLVTGNQVDFYRDYITSGEFSLVSPLNDRDFQYYRYALISKQAVDNDTIVHISVTPKNNDRPLLTGDLYLSFNNKVLLETELWGNDQVRNEASDSLYFYQKYGRQDGGFYLPVLTTIQTQINFVFRYKQHQTISYANYIINDQNDIPYLTTDQMVSTSVNMKYDVGIERDLIFKVPFTANEKAFEKVVEEKIVNAPWYKKIFLKGFTEVFPLALDGPGSIGNLRIRRASNWYRFSKVEGHYLGGEYQFFSDDKSELYTNAGYAIAAETFQFNIEARYLGLSLDAGQRVKNLGNFDYNRISDQSISALFDHKDHLNYYFSRYGSLFYTQNTVSDFYLKLGIEMEQRSALSNITEFSLFNKDAVFSPNFKMAKYNNNRFSIGLHYIENRDVLFLQPVNYRGRTFTNATLTLANQNRALLGASEDRLIIRGHLDYYYSMKYPRGFHLTIDGGKQFQTDYTQELSFVNKRRGSVVKAHPLGFYTLNDYEYAVDDYVSLRSELTLLALPKYYTIKPTLGVTANFLWSFNNNKSIPENTVAKPLTKPFAEYGLALRIWMFKLFILTNNQANRTIGAHFSL